MKLIKLPPRGVLALILYSATYIFSSQCEFAHVFTRVCISHTHEYIIGYTHMQMYTRAHRKKEGGSLHKTPDSAESERERERKCGT